MGGTEPGRLAQSSPATSRAPPSLYAQRRTSRSSIAGRIPSVKAADLLAWADPTDLDGLREALERADPEGKLAPIGMSRIEISAAALGRLPEVVSEFTGAGREAQRVVLAMDATPMRRNDGDPKDEAFVERILERARSAGGGL
jgi:hypothetical protein